ncbi:zf-HC2 domain-containing protein [Micromonospora sp. WMMD1155]|uniref:zf-HC2 domain-containing protein n=1 Tax=Micromonospora sp. WMMD1155 TaxID=3016094 RepID=UPI00249AF506|nr:zf-HC2 domain-containing protein [Micromonospora sp. WMMD1155]WFE53136.1 zf-HC2 domain-containing protein [Micromonospora sp. WMMD1155]
MGCEQWREILSAQLDGEETPAEQARAEAHLDGCAACRRWYDQAAAVTRRTRVRLSAPVPDLSHVILATLPTPRRERYRLVLALRAGLALIGALQLVLGLAQIGRGPSATHAHDPIGTLGSGHLWHEAAAWNIAVGAGFLFVAARRTPPTGLLPTLSAFVGTLLLLSVNDLMTGRVEPSRLVSHGFLLAGYLIVVALSRTRRRLDGPPTQGRTDRPAWHLAAGDEPPASPPGLRLAPPHPGTAQVRDRPAA